MNIERHLWTNGRYFTDNSNKVAGEIVSSTNRFGKPINIVRGTLADFIKIVPNAAPKIDNWLVTPVDISPPKEEVNFIEKALSATKSAGTPPTIGEDMLSFNDIREQFAANISDDRYRIWANYQKDRIFSESVVSKPGNGWNQFLKPITEKEYREFAKQGLVAYDGRGWVPDTIYFAGLVYDKAADMQRSKDRIIEKIGTDIYEQQIKRLRASAPGMIRLSAPANERLYIRPQDKFLNNFSVLQLTDGTVYDREMEILGAFTSWLYTIPRKEFKNGSSAFNIITYILEGKPMPRNTTPAKKADIKRSAEQDLNSLFTRFLSEMLTEPDQQRIEIEWNREYNGWVEHKYEDIPIGFEMNKWFKSGLISPRKALWDGVKFQTINGSSVIAFDVGVGKTMTAILAVAQALYTGQCKRPLIVVPNPTYKKWISELIGEYNEDGSTKVHGILPQYKDRINDYYNLGVDYIDRAKNNPPEDYSITFLTYEGLKNLGLSARLQDEIGLEMLNILSQGLDGRDKEQMREKIDGLMGDATADTVINFDDLGFDYFVMDEAHNAKKIFTQVKGDVEEDGKRETSGYALQAGAPSKLGIKSFMLAQYVMKRNGMRNVCLLTATPFTNSPLEIYSMLALVAYQSLQERGIDNIKAFFDKFVMETSEMVVTSRGGFEPKAVIKGFNNRLVLQNVIFSFMLHKTGEEANVKRPIKIVYPMTKDSDGITLPKADQVETALTPTVEQAYWIKEIAKFANEQKNEIEPHMASKYFDERGKLMGRDLLAVSLGRQVALCPYLLRVYENEEDYYYFMKTPNPTAEQIIEQSPKLKYTLEAIRTIKQWHDTHKEPMSGVVIYMNFGVEYLVPLSGYFASELGLNSNQVEIIGGGISAKKKEGIKERFLAGKTKILFGSSTIKEGIDLQNKSSTLFNLTLDWNPTDIQQLEGRIYRQGNQFSHVRIVTPLIENSVDVFMFQKLEEKTSRINTIWYRAGKGNVLDIDNFNPEELKLGLMTDPTERARVEIEQEIKEIDIKIEVLDENIKELAEARSVIDESDAAEERINDWFIEAKISLEKTLESAKARLSTDEYTAKKDKEQDERTVNGLTSLFEKVETGAQLARLALERRSVNDYLKGNPHGSWTMSSRLRTLDEQTKRYKQLDRLQRTVLNQNALSLSDDLKPLITKLEGDRQILMDNLSAAKSDDHFNDVKERLTQARIEADKSSKPLMERVKAFTKQNHLLSCMQGKHECDIKQLKVAKPKPEAPKADEQDKIKRIRIAKAKAKALLLLFEFQKLAA